MKPHTETSNSHGGPDSEFRWLEIDLDDALFLLRRHFVLLALIPIACAALAGVAWWLMPSIYTSSATVYLRPNFDQDMQLDRTFSKLEDADSLRSVEKALISDTVILRMVDKLGLRSEPDFVRCEVAAEGPLSDDCLLEEVRDRYDTKLVPNTRLIELDVDDHNPERAKLIADTLIKEFLVHLGSERESQEAELRATLVRQADAALEAALKSEKKLEGFRSEHPELIVEQDSSVFQDRLLQTSKTLNEASSERLQIEGMVAAIENIDAEKEPFRIFQVLQNRNSGYLSQLLSMHATAKAEMASASEKFTPTNPAYKEAAKKLADIEQTLTDYAGEMKEGMTSEFAAAQQREEKLTASMQELRSEFIAFKSKSAEFRGLKEEIDRNWNTHSRLQDKITGLDLNPENELSFITLISKPIVPENPSQPVLILWVPAGFLLGLGAVFAYLIVRYRRGLPYTSAEQSGEILRKSLGVPNLAHLHLADASDLEEASKSSELVDLAIALGNARIIQIAQPGEAGTKDALAPLLGQVLAERGVSTLLVRFRYDVDDPEMVYEPGSTNHLYEIELPVSELLNLEQFRQKLKNSLESYDRTIIDMSEIDNPEAILAVAKEADASVTVVKPGRGSRRPYRDLVERMVQENVSAVSTVVIDGGDKPLLPFHHSPQKQLPEHSFTKMEETAETNLGFAALYPEKAKSVETEADFESDTVVFDDPSALPAGREN